MDRGDLHPQFIQRMKKLLGDEWNDFQGAIRDDPTTAVRYNPFKPIAHPDYTPVPWCPEGYYLEDRPVFPHDPLWHAGVYYVQEPSSMFLGMAIQQIGIANRPICALDLCASPGGKSTHLTGLLHQETCLVSNEVIRSRVPMVRENIIKWGSGNVVVTNNDPRAFRNLPDKFDLIVVDAPCSGEGLFRKEPEWIQGWSPEIVDHCAARQQRILEDVIPSLKEDGYLIYCTCTYESAENEQRLSALLSSGMFESKRLSLPAESAIIETSAEGFGYRFYPHRVRGEGFFLSVLQKKKRETDNYIPRDKARHTYWQKTDNVALQNLDHAGFETWTNGKALFLFPASLDHFVQEAKQFLNISYAGVEAGREVRGEIIPAHPMALFHSETALWPSMELDEHDALEYLRKSAQPIATDQNGFIKLTFKEMSLGWIKNYKNGQTNMYPAEWRLRK